MRILGNTKKDSSDEVHTRVLDRTIKVFNSSPAKGIRDAVPNVLVANLDTAIKQLAHPLNTKFYGQ